MAKKTKKAAEKIKPALPDEDAPLKAEVTKTGKILIDIDKINEILNKKEKE
jgi:hypothetical protein